MNATDLPDKNVLAALQRYGDIIDLPHHRSRKHPQMSARMRAGQFSPYAALNGFAKVIDEEEQHSRE